MLDGVTPDADRPRKSGNMPVPSAFDMLRFVIFSGLTVLAAWIAATGRVAYVLIMLVIAGALVYAVVDLMDYEIVKRRRRG